MNLYRSRTDRVVAGVCGGLAQEWDWDLTGTRIIWAVGTICTGIVPGLLLYVALAIVLKSRP